MTDRRQSPAGLALATRLAVSPVLPTVGVDAVAGFLAAGSEVCLLHRVCLERFADTIGRLRDAGREAVVNVDSVAGLGRDRHALEYLRSVGVTGLLSSRLGLLQFARERGFVTMQALFVPAACEIEAHANAVASARPDLVLLMPSPVLPHLTVDERSQLGRIVAAGFIRSVGDVRQALRCGAKAVSSTNPALWGLTREEVA
ncbi:MAG: glycerol-3-phosphate responsive antiterminator [Propionibacteriaceae bacterium]|jgi:glycerol uptake operon antiterminator|nr:glycerol-3-phosphate responsive antiterminator [Propionibacteriaceae bacterium]